MYDAERRPLALIILDGWGVCESRDRNAIAQANTPNYDHLSRQFPMTTLVSSGMRVGLPDSEPGSAEAGHLNIGAGRRLKTSRLKIDEAIESKEFFANRVLVRSMLGSKARGGAIHLAGLLSDAGIHSSMEHLFALLRLAKKLELPQVYIHCFLDGRDVPVKTADIYVEALEVKMAEIGIGKIATLCGRHFAMDDDGNWERTARAYTMMVHSEGENVPEPKKAIRDAFVRGYTDEFIRPVIVESSHMVPVAQVKDGDLVIFFNHRNDTLRQLADSLAASGDSDAISFSKPIVEVVCLNQSDLSTNMTAAFPSESVVNSLGEVLSANETPSLRFTESERAVYLDGLFGRDGQDGLSRSVFLRSAEAATRQAKPEMASFKLADHFIEQFGPRKAAFYAINLPASALVAECGDLGKTIEAVQFVDTCLGGILDCVKKNNGIAIVTASHPGCERMTGNGRTSSNSVPCHLVDTFNDHIKLRPDGALEDIAPTILACLGIGKPAEMTGSDLRI